MSCRPLKSQSQSSQNTGSEKILKCPALDNELAQPWRVSFTSAVVCMTECALTCRGAIGLAGLDGRSSLCLGVCWSCWNTGSIGSYKPHSWLLFPMLVFFLYVCNNLYAAGILYFTLQNVNCTVQCWEECNVNKREARFICKPVFSCTASIEMSISVLDSFVELSFSNGVFKFLFLWVPNLTKIG